MRKYYIVRFCFNSKICKKYWVSESCKITNRFNTTHGPRHEIDIQSQRLAENVLNRVFILLSNRIQLFFRCAMDFQTSSGLLFWNTV